MRDLADTPRADTAFRALRRFIEARRPAEACELCGAAVGERHEHLVQTATQRLLCACDACAVLFTHAGATTHKRVPRRVRKLSGAQITNEQWEALSIPIGLAFFFYSTRQDRVAAFYPGPAGATESLLALDTWGDILRANPLLEEMQPDVEALLVNRMGPSHGPRTPVQYLVPIDACYRLVGLIRRHWRGFSGGSDAWTRIDGFFAELEATADTSG